MCESKISKLLQYNTNKSKQMGWEGIEPSTNRLKAGCSTTELPTRRLRAY
jgi:hypothetical protein